MAKYQAYAEYKDSGIEWLGKIPSSWNIYSIKRSISSCVNGFWGGEPDQKNDIIVLRVADFNRENFSINENKLTVRSIVSKDIKNIKLEKGDLLIEKSGGGDKTLVGCVVHFDKDFSAITSNFVAKMTPLKDINSKFLTYSFSHLYSGRVNFASIKQATGIQNLDSESYLINKFVFPPLTEQTQIATFLDYETAKIDTLIAKQKKLIELLKEKRQAVISHAVTRGLDPNVKMKPSGVEWLGKIPLNWELSKLNYSVNALSDVDHYMPKSIDLGIPYIMTGDLKDFVSDINFSKCKQVKYHDYLKLSKKIKTVKGDIIFARYATIGTVSYVDIDKNILVSYACVTIKPNRKKLVGLYLFWYLKSQVFLRSIQIYINSNTQSNIGIDSLKNIKIILPSITEQLKIIEFLNNQTQKIDKLISKAETAIKLMQERRTALISSAVTGKIDVRNWQKPQEA